MSIIIKDNFFSSLINKPISNDLLAHFEMNNYFEPYKNYETLLEYLLFKRKTIPKNLDWSDKRVLNMILPLANDETSYLQNENILLTPVKSTGETLLEVLFENGIEPKYQKEINNIQFINICIKYDRINYFSYASEELLNKQFTNGDLLIEYMVKNNIAPVDKYLESPHNNSLCERELLLKKFAKGKTLLDYITIYDNNYQISLKGSSKKDIDKINDILYQLKQTDNLKKITYISPSLYFVEIFKDIPLIKAILYYNPEYKINKIDSLELVKELLVVKRYRTIMKLCPINILFTKIPELNNQTIIDYLIPKYEETITLLKDLGKKAFDPDMIMKLREYGIKIKPKYIKQIGLAKKDKVSEYFIGFEKRNVRVPLEIEELLDEFHKVMNTGKKSNPDVLKILESIFLDNVMKNFDETIVRDFKTIIEIKKQNPKFNIRHDITSTSFLTTLDIDKGIKIKNGAFINIQRKYTSCVLLHELTHLLHSYYDLFNTPKEIKDYIKENENKISDVEHLASIIDFMSKGITYSKDYKEKLFTCYVNKEKGSVDQYKNEIRKDFKRLFGTKKLLLEVLASTHYSEELINYIYYGYKKNYDDISDKEYYMELYVKERLKDEYKTFITENFELSNGEFMLFQNFIDALTKGRLGNYYYTKKPTHDISTHNMDYFNKYDYRQFAEMLADYIALKRSPNGNYYITILSNIFDENLIDIMDEYYNNIHLNNTILNKNQIKKNLIKKS